MISVTLNPSPNVKSFSPLYLNVHANKTDGRSVGSKLPPSTVGIQIASMAFDAGMPISAAHQVNIGIITPCTKFVPSILVRKVPTSELKM